MTPKRRTSGTHRAALQAQITTELTRLDPQGAEVKARQIVETKASRNKAAVFIALCGLGMAGASWATHRPEWLTFTILAATGPAVGLKLSPEYARAWAKDAAEFVLTLGGAINTVRKG